MIQHDKINIKEKFSLFKEYFDPKIIAKVNNSHIKLVKFKGEFIWHHHEEADELFMVKKGNMNIETRSGIISLKEGEMVVIPKKMEHKPIAEEEVHVILIEPVGTVNTGNIQDKKTQRNIEFI